MSEVDKTKKNTGPGLDWWLLAGVSVSAIGVISIMLSIILKLERYIGLLPEMLNDFGIAFLISGIIIATVERIVSKSRRTETKEQCEQISANIIEAVYKHFSPKEIIDEISNYIFKSDVWYEDYETIGILKEKELSGKVFLCIDSRTEYKVHNPTSESRIYVTPIKYYNIDVLERIPIVEFYHLTITDEKGEKLIEYDKEQLAKTVKEDRDFGSCELEVLREIAPGKYITVRQNKRIYLRKEKDYHNILVTKPTLNIKARYEFPNDNYKYSIIQNRPGSSPPRFDAKVLKHENAIEAELRGGILPYQGFMLRYIHE